MKTKPPRHIALPLYAETLPAVCSLAPVSERAEGQTSIGPDPQKKTFLHNISLLFTLIRFACFFLPWVLYKQLGGVDVLLFLFPAGPRVCTSRNECVACADRTLSPQKIHNIVCRGHHSNNLISSPSSLH